LRSAYARRSASATRWSVSGASRSSIAPRTNRSCPRIEARRKPPDDGSGIVTRRKRPSSKTNGTVVDVLKNVPPCAPDPTPCNSVVPGAKADTVLEVNAGVADANGAVPDAKLKWVGIPGR
jgi:Uncharacterized ACR, COG1430